jgi:hypothetical protein
LDETLQEGRRRVLAHRAGSAILDGKIVVSAADGTTDFSVLQNELKGKSTKIVTLRLFTAAILMCDGVYRAGFATTQEAYECK